MAPAETPGRNDPCPCGSGKKYKKCCLPLQRDNSREQRAPVHTMDESLVAVLRHYGGERFGDEWAKAEEFFVDPDAAMQLYRPWSVYSYPVRGRPIAAWFLEEHSRRLAVSELRWLKAQQQSWLSVWEVLAVEPGSSVTVRDLLTGTEKTVHEVSGSKGLRRYDNILARVVDCDGEPVFCGVHYRVLSPADGNIVEGRIRARLRRKGAVEPGKLLELGGFMIRAWEDMIEERELSLRNMRLKNTDGENILVTVDYFDLIPGTEKEIAGKLAEIPGTEPPDEDGGGFTFTKPGNARHKSWSNTITGTAAITGGSLRVETNSVKRANALRKKIKAACGDLVRHRSREHDETLSVLGGLKQPQPLPVPLPGIEKIPPEELQRLTREFKQQFYRDWLEHPVPALGGATPLEAIKSRDGRGRVKVLLKEIENRESGLPEGERLDLSWFRKELGFSGAD